MNAILVTGPNACGKTTAVQKALQGYVTPTVVYADSGSTYKGPVAKVDEQFAALWNSDSPTLVVEGTNRAAAALFRIRNRSELRRRLVVFAMRASPEDLKALLEARCAKKGKTFRADYWTRKLLQYEGQVRIKNLILKELRLVRDGLWPAASVTWFDADPAFKSQPDLIAAIRAALGDAL